MAVGIGVALLTALLARFVGRDQEMSVEW